MEEMMRKEERGMEDKGGGGIRWEERGHD